MTASFPAIVISEADGKQEASLRQLELADLPDKDVLVEVSYSSLNYKDGLAVLGRRIARRLPLIAGIDLAGTVVESRSPDWTPGDRVVVNGRGMSETQPGGYSRYQRVDSEWLVRIPEAFTLEQAAAIGTAGFTAAMAVDALVDWGISRDREVLVTGAAGGVGSVAIALLARAGFRVTASTGRPATHDYLSTLGASAIIDRAELQQPGSALQKERWAGAVDTVGGVTLANIFAQTAARGAVAVCGLAGGSDLATTVMPMILRGVSLIGIDSVMASADARASAWRRLAEDLDPKLLADMTSIEPMSAVLDLAPQILAGQVRGRIVIDVTR